MSRVGKASQHHQHSSNRNPNKRRQRGKFCTIVMAVLYTIVKYVRFYIDLFIDYIFGLYYDSKKQIVPKPSNPLVLESAVSLANKIRKKQVTVEEVVTAFIDRVKEVNDLLNAVVDSRFDEAIAEAKKLDYEISIGNIQDVDFRDKPFLGIPFTAKESTAVKGLSHTFGLVRRKGVKAAYDADMVMELKNAGGICIGVTNIPQLNLWQETCNPLYGVTSNPYNTTRNVGGSSGGEASILAACGTAVGLGSDIGGSIRIPAFMCGIYGHKTTSDIVSMKGLTFRTGTEVGSIAVGGPMTRYAEDLIPLLKVLAGKNVNKLKLDQPIDVRDLRVYYVRDPKDLSVSMIRDEMDSVLLKTVQYFSDISLQKPEEVEFPGIINSGKLWQYCMVNEPNANFRRDIANREQEVNPIMEVLKYLTMFSGEFSLSTIALLLNSILPVPKDSWAKQEIEKLRNQVIDKLGTNGILIYPSAPFPASYHYTAFLRPFNFRLFALFNVLKLPVTQIPMGLSKDGLPLGIQVVAAPHNDHLTIAVAKALEKQFGGYVPPFPTD